MLKWQPTDLTMVPDQPTPGTVLAQEMGMARYELLNDELRFCRVS
jgi:hypothetical protein